MIRVDSPAALPGAVGSSATGQWFLVDQGRINQFAHVTEDFQWIHTDPERAASGPFGTTVAHGLLTLSLIPRLIDGLFQVAGASAVINCGIDRVRFIEPVPNGSRIRACTELTAAKSSRRGVRATLHHAIEVDGGLRPVLVADTVHLFIT